MPIRLKLSIWYSGISLLVMTLFCTYLYLFFTHREMNQIDTHLVERAHEVHQSIKVIDIYPFPMQRFVLPDIDVFSSSEVFLQVVDPRGLVLSRSESLGEHYLPFSEEAIARIHQKKDYFETKKVEDTLIRLYYLPLYSGERLIGILQVAESMYNFQRSLATLRLLLLIGVLSMATVSAVIGWFLARKALDPIQRIMEATAAVEREGKLDQRITYEGPADEIGKLSMQINAMMDKIQDMYSELEESYEAQRRFVADASHELRTPLTSIRGNMDFLRKLYIEKGIFSIEASEDILEELERVSRMVHNLLALARADAGYQVQMEVIDLRPWFDEWMGQIKQMETVHVRFKHESLDLVEGVRVKGNRDFLKQILLIFLENAFKYTKDGYVRLSFQVDPKQIKVVVEDTGMGIPPTDMSIIFDRFYRGANVRQLQGTGLGLSIAKWIADQHDASINIQSGLGEGTRVELTLPTL